MRNIKLYINNQIDMKIHSIMILIPLKNSKMIQDYIKFQQKQKLNKIMIYYGWIMVYNFNYI